MWNKKFAFERWAMGLVWAVGAVALGFAVGCETSSHKSVRTYDYSDEPRGARTSQPTETERVDDAGNWQMTKPGEMVVDPKRP